MATNEIFNYFQSNFGKVECVSVHPGPGYRFAIVAFDDYRNAEKASRLRQHTISGSIVTVSPPNSIQEQPSFQLLNDDCILAILKHLELADLCSVASTCLRMRELAQMDFTSKYKNGALTLEECDKSVANYLRNFGSQLNSLQLSRPRDPPSHTMLDGTYILHLLAEHCSSLTDLSFYNYAFKHRSDLNTKQLIPFFSRLKKLDLSRCEISGEILSILDVNEMRLDNVSAIEDNAEVRSFNRLKRLHIDCCLGHTPRYLDWVNYSKSVEYIQLNITQSKKAESAEIYRIISKFENTRTLEVYDHNWTDIKPVIEMVKRLSHLSELTLVYRHTFTVANLSSLIRNANNLEKLIVTFDENTDKNLEYPNNVKQFEKMVHAVSQRTNRKPLDVLIVGYEKRIKPFIVELPPQTSLKIKCFDWSKTESIESLEISNKMKQILRDRGRPGKWYVIA